MRIGNIWVYISLYGEKKPLNGLAPIFFLAGDIDDVITHAGFGDDRLRGSLVVWGSKFSISH